MLTDPIPATRMALERGGLTLDDIDALEINKAFASVPPGPGQGTRSRHDQSQLEGRAIALGHPLDASGANLMITLLNEKERTDGRHGLLRM